ncbi:hypothetical protein OIU77_010688 [Salix suchowensis]|uniref:Aminotransferase class I/classII large domain-containing protein n=1 Tax=Salix suchowensis TaxID=1278906 RepID=A0ABQ9A974_9ROSI|nr:hypothetical protein OIU77_010688 [Salix suchowensis]
MNGGRNHGGRWSFWRAFSRSEFVEIVPKKKALIEAMEKAGKGRKSLKLSSDDVFITLGCTQAIDVALTMLARPGANILLPRPGFPIYELCAAFRSLEVRHFDLLPEKGFEADLDAIAALADQNSEVLCEFF